MFRRRRLRRLIPAALAALAPATVPPPAHAQRVTRSETNAWLDASADIWLTPRTGLQAQLLYERSDFGEDPMQTEARLGAQRMLHSGARVAVGGTFIHNSPYGPFPARAPFDEYRAWEQLQVDQRLGVVALAHRYRLEQRWVQRPSALATAGGHVDVAYGMRFRYQARGTVPLTSAASPHPLYAALADEIFVSLGPHAPLNLLDQNRGYAGLGVRWSTRLRSELGYLSQIVLRSDGRQVENNHTVQLTLGVTRPAPTRR